MIMKKSILLFMIVGILFSCSKKESETNLTSVVGRWKLTEVLMDPGDGSGTFMSVNSDKTLIFDNNGNVTSNGLICDMSIGINSNSSGIYSVPNASINSSSCPNTTLQFELINNTLILIYPCIEPCKAKYIKVQ